MKKSTILSVIPLALGILPRLGLSASTSAPTEATRPNVVFVLFDDMGYGEPRCYRNESEFKMPNMDRLAKEGMRFTDAHAAAAACTPTRYGIITGRYPSRIGQYAVLAHYSPPIIPTTRLTVASLMKQNGYDTACIGKWHLGMDWGDITGNPAHIPVGTQLKQSPNAAGFDYFYGYRGLRAATRWTRAVNKDDERKKRNVLQTGGKVEIHRG